MNVARGAQSAMSSCASTGMSPAFRLLGAKTLGVSDDYMNERMPPVNVGLLDGHLAWRQHDGGHTDAPYLMKLPAIQ